MQTFGYFIQDTISMFVACIPLPSVDGCCLGADSTLLELTMTMRLALLQKTHVDILVGISEGIIIMCMAILDFNLYLYNT